MVQRFLHKNIRFRKTKKNSPVTIVTPRAARRMHKKRPTKKQQGQGAHPVVCQPANKSKDPILLRARCSGIQSQKSVKSSKGPKPRPANRLSFLYSGVVYRKSANTDVIYLFQNPNIDFPRVENGLDEQRQI